MNSLKSTGQRFGNRIIVRDWCADDDWLKLGLKIPARKDKYKLTQCLNCGSILPCEISNLHRQPPKRCVFCSNIGNHSKVDTYTNSWAVYDDYAVCNVSYNRKIVSAYIDTHDYDKACKYIWRISKKRQKYYVVSGSFKKGTQVYLHNLIYGECPNEFEIDHIDGNSLNNRRSNLRLVSHQENIDNQRATRIDNQIGIRGVVYNRNAKKFKVDFYYHDQRYYTRSWNTVEEAVWCRYCFEDYFGLPSIKNNPLSKQYDTLNSQQKQAIYDYVLEQILRNERYKSLHTCQQLSENS